jgi:hypothetical protein
MSDLGKTRVFLRCKNPALELAVRLGPGEVVPSGGVGGAEAIELPHNRSAVHWETHPPLALTLPLLFDGHQKDLNVEDELADLRRLARAEPGARRPPSVVVEGPIPLSGTAWLINGLEYGACIRRESDDKRTRQVVTVQLIEDREVEDVIKRTRRRPARTSGRTHTVKRGETLRSIAAKHKVKGGWRALAKLQRPPIRDPRTLDVGDRLRLP